MPEYEPPDEILRHEGVPRGKIVDTTFNAVSLNNSRPVKIYLPAGYEYSSRHYPVVLFHDGLDYLALASTANVLDNLIDRGEIPPCIAVFVPAVNRSPEYAGNQIDSFTDFIVNTVMRYVDKCYRTITDPAARAVMGASNGGNISLYIAMKHPDVFGCLAAQSSNIISSISTTFNDGPLLPLRLYLDLGAYDIAVLIPLVRNFVSILQAKGYDHLYQEFNEGHSWGNWRAHIDDALVFFFSDLLTAKDTPVPASEGFRLSPVWPNPATEQVTLPFALPRGTHLRVALHDALGREVRRLHEGYRHAGSGQLTFGLAGVPSGVYYLRVTGNDVTQVRRVAVR
jgi:enterochelin esterase-like enzyme